MIRAGRKDRITATGVASLAGVTALAYFLGIDPTVRSRAAVASAAAEVETARRHEGELGIRVADQRRELGRLASELDTMKVKLRPATQVNEFMQELSAKANESGVVIETMQQAAPVYKERYGTVQVRLQARGSFVQCTRFVRLLGENNDVGVSGLDLSGNPMEKDSKPLLVMDVLWYVAPSAQK